MSKILIVDDDHAILESMKYLLEYAGYEVKTEEDGSFVDEFWTKPDLILLDYWLPNQNGGEITKKLKSKEETKHIPIIIISASLNIKELVEKAGADDFLSKPYDMEVLLKKVEKYIKKGHYPH